MNKLKKAIVVASATVMSAIPFAPSVSSNVSLFCVNTITASAAKSSYKTPNISKLNNGRKCYDARYDSGRCYEDVKWIQDVYMKVRSTQYYYNQLYAFPSIKVDGYYGPKTRDAIIAFQSWYHLDYVDGLAGAETILKLKDLLPTI